MSSSVRKSEFGLVSDTHFAGESFTEQSPEYMRTSFAAAITMGFVQGRFFRDAKLYCLNLLLTYADGCVGRCAYCGLSRTREDSQSWRERSFIRVDWPIFKTDEIMNRIGSETCSHVERVCVSMITHRRAPRDTLSIIRRLHDKMEAISALITPTIVDKGWLLEAKEAGADKVGIAIDAATPELFHKLRGRGVSGPHKWERYWRAVQEGIEIFGRHNVGIHLIVGLGETEREMIEIIQMAYDKGALSHLFSFFPEQGSLMHRHKQPPVGSYRRVQLARYLINKGMTCADKMGFDGNGRVVDFGLDDSVLHDAINSGMPFVISGCSTKRMENACNRPFSDSTPYQAYIGELRNFPFIPDEKDVSIAKRQLGDYSDRPPRVWIDDIGCENCLDII